MALRAAAYTRYSSDNQREESIDAQIRAITEYCQRKGYLLVNNYADEAKSATSDQRPNFQRMISDSRINHFDVVVVHKLDRFARDRFDSAYYKRELRIAGVRLESVLENIDGSPESIMLESILEGMAEYYSKNLAREALKGMRENALKAKHAGGRPPFGYRVNPETMLLEIDEHAATVVRIYFEGVAAGRSTTDIANELNERGFRTQTGRRFTRNSFDGWARNRKYIGTYTWNVKSSKDARNKRNNHMERPIEEQTIVEDAIPSIVDKALFDKVGKIMEERKLHPGWMKAKEIYFLSGKLICGQCGAIYRGESYRNSKSSQGTRLKFYKCGARCGNANLRKLEIEDIVIEFIVHEVFTDAVMQQIADRVVRLYQSQVGHASSDKSPIRNEIAELDKKIDNWIQAIGQGILDQNILSTYIKEAAQRKTVLESELARIEAMEAAQTLNESDVIAWLISKKDALFSLNDEEKKSAVQALIEKVVIMPSKSIDDHSIEISCRFFNGGGDGSRTRVRRSRYMNFYGCSTFTRCPHHTRTHTLALGKFAKFHRRSTNKNRRLSR